MFENLQMAPPDAILGLTEAFESDPNPNKINLSVGVYKDAAGVTPILSCVKKAEKRLADNQTSKAYLPIDGAAEYGSLVRNMLFGPTHEIVTGSRAVTANTPGGTGGLRVAADFIHKAFPGATVWLSKPTWPNHPSIFAAAGVPTDSYAYFDADANCLAFDAMIESLGTIPAGDVVLLHGCCHNPSGIDPTAEQWAQIAGVVASRGLLPLVDFAYQGFGSGLEEDATGLRALCGAAKELLICSSFSKNFGLYCDRVGALTLVAASADEAKVVQSLVKQCVRSNYSNPPAHGSAIVTTILSDEQLTAEWHGELAQMRDRINGMRHAFVDTMKAKGVTQDCSFITEQRGMFSFSGLNRVQVDRLKSEYSVYIVGSGRINVAGITPANIDRLCESIAAVV